LGGGGTNCMNGKTASFRAKFLQGGKNCPAKLRVGGVQTRWQVGDAKKEVGRETNQMQNKGWHNGACFKGKRLAYLEVYCNKNSWVWFVLTDAEMG